MKLSAPKFIRETVTITKDSHKSLLTQVDILTIRLKDQTAAASLFRKELEVLRKENIRLQQQLQAQQEGMAVAYRTLSELHSFLGDPALWEKLMMSMSCVSLPLQPTTSITADEKELKP